MKNIFNHKLFRVILFIVLLNIDEILSLQVLSLQKFGITKILIDGCIGFIAVYVISASWVKNEEKGNQFFVKKPLWLKLVFLVIFLVLMNISEIIELKAPDILHNLVYLSFAALLLFYLVPAWKKYDLSRQKTKNQKGKPVKKPRKK